MSYLVSRTALMTVFALILTNTLHFQIPGFGLILLILFSMLTSLRLGYAATQSKSALIQATVGAWILLGATAVMGSLIYYFGHVTTESMLLMTGILTALSLTVKNPEFEQSRQPIELRFGIGMIIIGVLVYTVVTAVTSVTITESVRSMWSEVDPMLLIPFGMAVLTALALLVRRQRKFLQILVLSSVLLTATLMGVIAYAHGLGFDPFIHQATVSHIAEYGSITPKPFYYIGQYALELVSHLVFLQDVSWTDKLLVPLLTGLLLPATAYIGLMSITKRYAVFGAAIILLAPLGSFVITTPQALGYLFFTAQLFLTLPNILYREKTNIHWSVIALIAVATLTIHPIAGIASLLLLSISLVSLVKAKQLRWSLAGAWFVLGTTLFPLTFFAQSFISKLPLSLQFPDAGLTAPSFSQFQPVLDLLYLQIHWSLWIILALAITGATMVLRAKSHKSLLITAALAAVLFGNYALMQFISFDFLIDYERQNYTNRLLVLGVLAALPLAAVALMKLLQRLQSLPRPLMASFMVALSLLVTANVYGAYPRHDVHHFSRDYNLSSQDLETVELIEQDSASEPYAVLANQMVSAAALKTYGFAHYYRNNTAFYYPVPTSDTLYQYYLDMVDESPRREVALAAMDYMGVDQIYLVVNTYWWDAARVIEQAKSTADEWIAVEDTNVIFLFRRSAD